jgi:hypothetical protein
MEAHGPLTRRGNSLPADSRSRFEASEPTRNLPAKPGTTFSHIISAREMASAGHGNPAPEAEGAAAHLGAKPHVAELFLGGRGSLLKDIASLIGLDHAARLISAFGGMRLYVPRSPEPDDTLSELIGSAAACALARIYGGDRIDVPNPTPRRIQIIELRASGVSIDVIARSLHCTRRRVFQVLAEARRRKRRAGC